VPDESAEIPHRGAFDKSVRRKPLARARGTPELWVLNGGLATEPAIMGGSFPDRPTEGRVRAMGMADGGPLVWVEELPFCRVQAHTHCVCRSTLSKSQTGPVATSYQWRRPAVFPPAGSAWLSIARLHASFHRSTDIAA
jgi:hypothetical protein